MSSSLPTHGIIKVGKALLDRQTKPINPALTRQPLTHVPQCHIRVSFEQFQGWSLHHCLEQPAPVPDDPSSEGIFSNIRSKRPVVQLPRLWRVRRGSHPEPALPARLSSAGCPARAARHKVSVLTHSGMETSLLQGDPRSSASSSTEFIPPRPTRPALGARRRSALNLPLVLSWKRSWNMGGIRIPLKQPCPVPCRGSVCLSWTQQENWKAFLGLNF